MLDFKKNIETRTFKVVLNKFLPSDKEIDFLSIDVEGLDFKVLKSINFDKYKPKVILIEILESSFKDIDNSEISEFLKKNNYLVYAKALNTVFFMEMGFYESRYKK